MPLDYGFLGERESEGQVSLVLVGHSCKETRNDVGDAGSQNWNGISLDRIGYNRVTLRCDNEPAIEALNRTSTPRRKPDLSRRDHQWWKATTGSSNLRLDL